MIPIEPRNVGTLLVRATNWVGDAVMSIPALREIRRVFSNAHITLLARPWVRDVYAAADYVDVVLEYDRRGEFRGWHGPLRLSRRLAASRFDMAILLQNAFEAALVARLASIPVRLGYSRDGRGFLLTHPFGIDPELRAVHQAYYYLGLLSAAGLIPPAPWRNPDREPDISARVGASDLQAGCELLRSSGVTAGELLIGLNPGAYYGGAKRWLLDRYACVADRLAERHGARILIFGTPGERQIADEVASNMRCRPLVLAGATTLGQLMAVIQACGLFITNDSGPMHLAAALGVPQVAIFGSTCDIATGPLGTRARVIRAQVECSPCLLRECPIDFRCMTGVSVDMVVEAAEGALAQGAPRFAG